MVSRSTANQTWPSLTVPPTSRATLGTPFSKGTEPPPRQATALPVSRQARLPKPYPAWGCWGEPPPVLRLLARSAQQAEAAMLLGLTTAAQQASGLRGPATAARQVKAPVLPGRAPAAQQAEAPVLAGVAPATQKAEAPVLHPRHSRREPPHGHYSARPLNRVNGGARF